jgi:AcrR family transcriptional regulator
VPQQQRSERRVAELLAAAAAVIADVGYDAATMTGIAQRAGASIGALYQYFPNKDAVLRALRRQYGEELGRCWTVLDSEAAALPAAQMVDRIVDAMVEFMTQRPAYLVLLDAPISYRRDPEARNRLRERFAGLLRLRRSGLAQPRALHVATVALQILKGLLNLFGEVQAAERPQLVEEFKVILTQFLVRVDAAADREERLKSAQ